MISKLEDVVKDGKNYGNKARNLSILTNQGILIPRGIAISYEHYIDYLNSSTFKDDFEKRIFKNLVNIDEPYAVRSSANIEDSEKKSYAGQFKTILRVKRSDIVKSIKYVYDSAINFNNLYSRCDIKMGVIIQEMIDSEISGIMFTYDIINKNSNSIIIELSAGECESIASGRIDPSLYILDKNSGEILLFEEGSQNILLNNKYISKILCNAKKIEDIFKRYQDIEFLFNSDKFYCLQSRDITII